MTHHRSCPGVYDDCIRVTVLLTKQILKNDRLTMKMIVTMSEIPRDARDALRVLAHTPAGQIALQGWKRHVESKSIEGCSILEPYPWEDGVLLDEQNRKNVRKKLHFLNHKIDN